ncbi:hypothetical protein EON65_34940 [archaeon]|nr:MAG: hypothetical protein EON65_34940 [archaeon]
MSEIIRKVPLVVGKVKPILRDLGWILLKTKKPDDNIFFPPWTVHKLETDLKVILTSKKYVSESLLCNLTERTADRLRAPTEALRYRPEHRLDLEYVRISNNTLFYRERWLWFVNSLQTYYLDRMLDYFKKSLSTVETLLADPAEGENRQADERETYIGDQDQAGIRIIDQGPIPYLDLSTHSTEDSVEVGAQSSEESDGDDVVGIFDEPTSSHNDNAHVSEVSSPSTPDQPKMQALAETGANNTSKRKHSAVQGHVDTQANKNDGSRMAIMQQEDRDTDNLPLGHVKKQAKTISFTFNDNPPTKLPPHTVCFPNLLSQADLAGTLSSLLSISCVNSCEVTCSLLRSTDGIFTLRDLLKQCCVRIGGVTSSINPAVLDMEIMEVLVGIGKAVQSSSHSAHRDPQAYDSDAALPSALISVPNDSVVVGSSFPVRETIAGVLGVEEDVGMLIQWYLEDFMLFRSHSK